MRRDSLREAARSLIHDGRFTTVAVTLLAVTLGAVTAVYAVVLAVVVRPFSFTDQDKLVVIWQRDDRRAQPVIEV
jgi:putative ABC transport system permease protein